MISISEEPLLHLSSDAQDEKAIVVSATGDIDLSSAPRLTAQLNQVLDADPAVLVVDLSSVSFIDSSGLTALVVAGRRAGELRVVARAGGRIDKLWTLCGLDLTFPLYETRRDAFAEGQLGLATV